MNLSELGIYVRSFIIAVLGSILIDFGLYTGEIAPKVAGGLLVATALMFSGNAVLTNDPKETAQHYLILASIGAVLVIYGALSGDLLWVVIGVVIAVEQVVRGQET